MMAFIMGDGTLSARVNMALMVLASHLGASSPSATRDAPTPASRANLSGSVSGAATPACAEDTSVFCKATAASAGRLASCPGLERPHNVSSVRLLAGVTVSGTACPPEDATPRLSTVMLAPP